MNLADHKKLGRFLSLVLRHRPDAAGVELDEAGWCSVANLVDGVRAAGHAVDARTLMDVVAADAKGRFELNAAKTRIRAAQGHSVDVDLGLDPVEPPATLYHGTVPAFLAGIEALGLIKGKRRHVHLSGDVETAQAVGRRRGTPVVLPIDAAGMHADGCLFFRSANGVWLTDAVPERWIDWSKLVFESPSDRAE